MQGTGQEGKAELVRLSQKHNHTDTRTNAFIISLTLKLLTASSTHTFRGIVVTLNFTQFFLYNCIVLLYSKNERHEMTESSQL